MLSFPAFDYRFQKQNGKLYIWDIVRKCYVLITPEEWVRQHTIHYLVRQGYPVGRMSVEKVFFYQQLTKRVDIVVWSERGSPLVLVECKAPNISISKNTLEQIAIYQACVPARFWIITNGIEIFFVDVSLPNTFFNQIPPFDSLTKF
ncbi:MAG: type I restriction enzyme HsdR N-terminal domain-containing protein [Cytophagales bacterium]|nr:type I restriction enzyme HsdR N-terminal domain-containing protein [Cytophagales bacterium]MDW8384339.1 type I restriction enzyme HsdR N-terminal domain-containing protein [Flammeovirgaceae bacterium]